MRMVKLTQPNDMGELALIKSLLDANGIEYVVQHEHMSSLYPGVLFLMCPVMVMDSDVERATMLLSKLRTREPAEEANSA
ncbi:MAG: putative signal transducing protein [Nitrospiraceae bacterium]